MRTLLVLLCAFPLLVMAQIPKGTSRIVITNENTKDQNMKLVTQTLIDSGYLIAKHDLEYGTISTEERPAAKKQPLHKLNFVVKDNSIHVAGQAMTGIALTLSGVTMEDQWFQIENKGMSGSILYQAFQLLNNFALKLEGGKNLHNPIAHFI